MKLKIFCDTHLGSPIEMKPDGLFKADENTILAGDIIDLSNVKNKMIGYYKELFDELRLIHGENYIIGNHEKMGTENEFVIKTTESGTRICILHGDIEANPKRWIRYRQEPHGAGWFKRKFIIPFIREAEEIVERKPKGKATVIVTPVMSVISVSMLSLVYKSSWRQNQRKIH
jgi:hypothetical protein